MELIKPTEEMLESQRFFLSNEGRLNRVVEMLADDLSRNVLKSVIEYRGNRTPIQASLYSENDQYFVKGIIQIENDEVFVDGGAYTGDTIQQLLDIARKNHKNIKKIIAFEPDSYNFSLLTRFFGNRLNIELFPLGLYSKNEELFFAGNGASAKVVDSKNKATTVINTINIDSLPDCNEITWIKMDIEGAEWDALHGAEKTIKKNKPKLTICIYHSNEDMIRIAEYIHGIVPEYKLYIRHHSRWMVETVLYAIP